MADITEIADKHEPGDIVRLPTGGPDMTLGKPHADGTSSCHWFDKSGEYHEQRISVKALVKGGKAKPKE